MFIIKCSGSFTDPCMECKSFYAVIVLNLILFQFNSVNKYIMLQRILEGYTFSNFSENSGIIIPKPIINIRGQFFFLIKYFSTKLCIYDFSMSSLSYKVLNILELNRTIVGSVRKIPLMIKYENLSCEKLFILVLYLTFINIIDYFWRDDLS